MKDLILIENCQITKTGLKFSEKLSFEAWQEVGKQLQTIHGSIQWWIGDWLNFGERKYGETYTQAIEETGLDYDTLAQYKIVTHIVIHRVIHTYEPLIHRHKKPTNTPINEENTAF